MDDKRDLEGPGCVIACILWRLKKSIGNDSDVFAWVLEIAILTVRCGGDEEGHHLVSKWRHKRNPNLICSLFSVVHTRENDARVLINIQL